jgi:hypothetical protein
LTVVTGKSRAALEKQLIIKKKTRQLCKQASAVPYIHTLFCKVKGWFMGILMIAAITAKS